MYSKYHIGREKVDRKLKWRFDKFLNWLDEREGRSFENLKEIIDKCGTAAETFHSAFREKVAERIYKEWG